MSDDLARATIDGSSVERFVSLRRALGVSSFGINQLTLLSGQRARIHRHRDQEEVYLVICGVMTLIIEGKAHELRAGKLARVAPEVRRQLTNPGGTPCVVVAIGGSGTHVSRDGEAFETWDDTSGRPPQEVPLPSDIQR
jgi:mannose-6-phosphate isomerase-like protein (cupin superfamily)